MTIFLSYSREDADRLGPLVEDLEQFGRPVWRDEKLSGGVDWWRRILQQIRECETFLLAVSEASLTSEACVYETEYAHAVHRQIIPVRLEDVAVTLAPASVAAILSQTQWIDYRSGHKQETIDLLRALSDRVARELPDPLPPEPRVPGSYVTDLQAEVEAPEELEVRDQMALFFRLKELGETQRDRTAAIQLLQRLRRRQDLRTRVSDQIDSLVAEWTRAPDAGATEGRTTPAQAGTQAAPVAPAAAKEEAPPPPDSGPRSHKEHPAQRWHGDLVGQSRLMRHLRIRLDHSEHDVVFSREMASNTVKLDAEVVAGEWRMASSSPWDYGFDVPDGEQAHPATVSVKIRESLLGDRIEGFRVVVAGRVVYSENWD